MQKLKARFAIHKVAQQRGISTAQCRAEIAAAIDQAWNNADPIVRQRQIDLVGDTHKPTPEEFLSIILTKIT